MPMQVYVRQASFIGSSVLWTVKERLILPVSHREVWVPVWQDHNLQTNYGLTAYAGAFGGSYSAPLWLVINTDMTTMTSLTGLSLVTPARIDKAGDTRIIMGLGLASQESVQFDSVSGSGPYTYALHAAPSNSHSAGENIARDVTINDTLSSINAEAQFDAANFPGTRSQTIGGYSGGTANYVMQFFLTGSQAQFKFASLGLSDSPLIGQGNLHNHLVSGYNHSAGNDVEIDVSITLTNV